MKTSKQLLAVIIPMYNEELHAQKCIKKVLEYVLLLPYTKLFIVNDASIDRTKDILTRLSNKYKQENIQIIHHKVNKGYGGAIITGANVASKQMFHYLLFMDSDLTNHPKFIKDFYKVIPHNYDCVKASRFILKGKMIGVPLYRQLFSYSGNLIANICFRMGINDYTNGFRMIKTSTLNKMRLKENSFSIILEEMYQLKKLSGTVCEIPTVLTNRKVTDSHFTYSPKLLYDYLKYAMKASFL